MLIQDVLNERLFLEYIMLIPFALVFIVLYFNFISNVDEIKLK